MNDSAAGDTSAATAAGQRKDKAALKELSQNELLKQAERYFGLLQIAKSKFSELSAKCRSLEEERDNAFIVLAKLKSVNCVASIDELQNKINSLEQNAIQCENHARFADEKVSEVEQFKCLLQEEKQEKEKLLRKYNSLEEETECRKMQIQTLTVTFQSIEDNVTALNAKNKELSDENQILTEARDSMMAALKSVKEQFSTMKTQSEEQAMEINSLNEQKQVLEEELASFQEERKQIFDEELKSILQLLPEMESASSRSDSNAQLNSKYQELNDFSSMLISKFENVGLHYKDLKSSLAMTTAKYGELIKENENLKDVAKENVEMQNLEQRLSEITNDNVILMEEKAKHLSEIDTVKLEGIAKTEKFNTISKEKENIITAIQDMYSNVFVDRPPSENDMPIDIINLLRDNYKSMLEKVRILEKNDAKTKLQEMFDKCMTYEEEISSLSMKLENQVKENADLQAQMDDGTDWKMKFEVAIEEKGILEADMSVVTEKQKQYLDEIENLKQQLDEYENDIQKHQNLEQDNISLNEMLEELEARNNKLDELYESKCVELGDLACGLNLLIGGLRFKLGRSELLINETLEDAVIKENICILQSLFDDLCSKLSSVEENAATFSDQLENLEKEKNRYVDELHQIQDLKQFLEYENRALSEEIFQLKSEKNVKDVASETIAQNQTINILSDAVVQASVDCADVAIAAEQFVPETSAPVVQLKNLPEMPMVSEWGYASSASPFEDGKDPTLTNQHAFMFPQTKSETPKETKFLNDASVQVEVEKRNVTVETEEIISTSSVPQQMSLPNYSDFGMVTEWGYAGENPPCQATGNDSKMNDLHEENQRLSSLLETKSGLTEKIHCEVDHLLGKVEELTVEINEKESDLSAAMVKNKKFEKEIRDLKDVIASLRHKANNNINEARVIKDYLRKSHEGFETNFKMTCSTIGETVEHLQAKYTNCYAMLTKYKFKNLDLEDGKLQLERNCNYLVDTFIQLLDSTIENLPADNSLPVSDIKRVFNVADLSFVNEFTANVDLLKTVLQVVWQGNHENNQNVPTVPGEKISNTSIDSAVEPVVCLSCEQLQNQLSESEIKLNKLKAVAIKIKRELNESTQMGKTLNEEKEKLTLKIAELSDEINELSSQHRQYVQNYQNLQCEYDKAQDENDKVKAENKTFQNDLTSTLVELNNLKQSLSEKDFEMKKRSEAFDFTEKEKSTLKSKMNDVDSKLIISESKHQDSQKKIQEQVNEIQKLQSQISELEKDKKELTTKVEEALMKTKQHSLLDLEMADYERTVAELTEQVQKKVSEIVELNGELENCRTKIQAQEDQIKFCENHRVTEEKRAEGFKSSLEDTKKELAILRDCELSLRNQLTDFTSKVKVLSLREEEYKTELSQLSGEVEQMKEMLRSSDESHQRIVQSLNAKISTQKEDILLANKEVENVKQDFESYKVRVHTVLKQQKSTAPFASDDKEMKEKLEAQNDKLKLQLKDVSEKLQAYKLESETQLEEHDHLLQRHSKVVEELEAKDRYWNQKLEQATDERNKLQDLVKMMSSEQALKNEMLASTYKKQIKLIQEENKHIIQGLQKQLESADVEISKLQRDHQKSMVSPSASATGQDENSNPFDFSSQERQECEGSECTDGGSTPIRSLSLATISTSSFLPLEKLLQSPPEPHTPTSTISNQDSERLNSELNSSWRKIDHLSELLNESEASNLRMSEQVRVLKEEIRRQERNTQREEHAKNMEYLKNVFFKFATLPPGSEKVRLVPVLNTMLKLSPDETNQLKDIAGDMDPSGAASKDGWGNYLHRWSGMM